MSTNRPSLWRVVSDTSRIISAHSLHFLALSTLFLFPISVATTIYSFLLQPTSVHSHNVVVNDIPPVPKSQLLIHVLYFLLVHLFSLCAIPSITYSTFNGFYGRPVNLISSLKSILVSFFPLLATILVAEITMGLITFAFVILMLLAHSGLSLLGLEMDDDNNYFDVFDIVIVVLLVGLLIYLQVEWYLMNAVVVLESRWGFAPLGRSSYLVKGMRGVVLLMTLFFGILSGLLSIWYMNVVTMNEGWTGWLVVQSVVFALLLTVLSLYSLAANTAVFVYCKALYGELAFQIDEFGGEYVPLPFHAVNVV